MNIHPPFSVSLVQPTGWSDKLIISNVSGTQTDSPLIRAGDTIYIDWAVANTGESFIPAGFWVSLYADGVEVKQWPVYGPFKAGDSYTIEDFAIGQLSVGTHSIRFAADPSGYLSEANAYDNEYTKTITVQSGSTALPNLLPYQTSGWSDKIVLSTAAGSRIGANTFNPTDSIYLNWAIQNDSQYDVTSTFFTSILIHGVEIQRWTHSPPLPATYYSNVSDYQIGRLSSGNHTITLKTDVTQAITESNENDNEYSIGISVSGSPIDPRSVYRRPIPASSLRQMMLSRQSQRKR